MFRLSRTRQFERFLSQRLPSRSFWISTVRKFHHWRFDTSQRVLETRTECFHFKYFPRERSNKYDRKAPFRREDYTERTRAKTFFPRFYSPNSPVKFLSIFREGSCTDTGTSISNSLYRVHFSSVVKAVTVCVPVAYASLKD